MSFASGFATGLAKSVDDQLKKDMLRTQARMDGMQQYRVTRKRADNERKAKEGDDLAELLNGYASFTNGDLDKAEQIFKYAGGNLNSGKEFLQTLKDNREVSKDFKIEDFATFHDRARDKNVTVNEIAKNYIKNSVPIVKEKVKRAGLLNFIGDGSNIESTLNADVDNSVTSTEDTFGTFEQKSLKAFNHSKLIAFKKYQKDNRRKYGTTYKADLIILEGEFSNATEPAEKAKLQKEIAQRRADINLEAANALAGKTKATSFFSKPQIGTLIKETKNGALKGVSSQVEGIDGIIAKVIEGKEAEAFEKQRNAFAALKKAYAPANSAILNDSIAAQQDAINLEIKNYIQDFTLGRRVRKGKKLHPVMTNAQITAGIKSSGSGTTKTKPLINIGDVVQIKLPNGGVQIGIYTGSDFINGQMPVPVAAQ